MSMPSFPENGTNMTREQALTMIIASIAMEESALSRVIDAEGDKLRYVLDRCREACDCCGTLKEILEVNCSVTRLLNAAAQNQMILRSKLSLALNGGGECPPGPPCPPPCPPLPPGPPCLETPQKSFMQLRLPEDGFLWNRGCLIPWKYSGGRGSAVCWNIENPALVMLDPCKAWSVNCTFIIRDFMPRLTSGHICMEGANSSGDLLPLCFSLHCACGEAVTLPCAALLLPGSTSAVSFRLRADLPLWVEQAELNIVEL